MTAVDLPDLQGLPGRLDRLARLVAAAHAALPADEAPCFAHLRVRSVRGVRDLLLGARSHLGGGVTILDWQTAPLAQVFFGCLEGDEYELELDGRVLLGEVLERSLLRMEAGQLVEVRTADEAWTRGADGAWTQGRRHEALRIGAGDGVAARHRGGSLEDVASAYEEFCLRVLEVVAPLVAIVKPQSAFFEACGPAGLTALQTILSRARDTSMLIAVR